MSLAPLPCPPCKLCGQAGDSPFSVYCSTCRPNVLAHFLHRKTKWVPPKVLVRKESAK